MGEISARILAMTESFYIFGGMFAHFSPEIMNKHNIKETGSRGNIWGPFYTPKGEYLAGD